MAYVKTTDFSAKDALASGNPAKIVKGTEIDDEFNAIETADSLNLKTTALGTGVETFLGTPSSANLKAAMTDELGSASGKVIFSEGTLAVASGKTLTVSNTVTLTGTDSTSYNLDALTSVPQNSQSAGYTLVLGDAGKHIYMASAGTFTIPANASVAFPVGATITFYNASASSTIPITSDTLVLAGAGTTGTRTLAQYALATIVKVASTTWVISGTGVT